MLGVNKDKEFKIENYEKFYENHQFIETSDENATAVHEIVPRFSWGFDQVEKCQPKSFLDLGTLEGSFPITIATHFGIPCVGVDLTKDGIRLARERAERLELPCKFYRGTVEHWLEKFAEEGRKFDMVSWFELIEHVKDVDKVIGLIDKVLAPEGSVIVSTPAFESPLYGADDEKNKCHIRLFTTKEEDYEAENKFGNVRKATSIVKQIGKDRIKELGVYSHLIYCRYQ